MTATVLVNGIAVSDPLHAIAVDDRGLCYGDGVFETMLVKDGTVRFIDDHLARLTLGCQALRIPCADDVLLRREIEQLSTTAPECIVKIIVTRGTSGRGYRAPEDANSTRIVSRHAITSPSPVAGIATCWCDTRLGRNPALASIKHLNRLEQVLAQSEFSAAEFGEGLMLDSEGEVISGTATNLFAVIDGVLCTPDLRNCGIRGVMRAQVLKAARRLSLTTTECALQPDDLARATELFVTNAIRGIVPVKSLGAQQYPANDLARTLANTLKL
jgi:4-amino-4-deoxychorismate lyase